MQPKAQPIRMQMAPQMTAADDLDWLFGVAESAVGIRSTFGAMIDALKVGHQETRVDERGLHSVAHENLHHEATAIGCGRGPTQLSRSAATRKYGRVVKVFSKLAPLHKRVLEAWFYPRQWPIQVASYFGRGAGVVYLCGSSVDTDITERGLGALASANSPKAQRIREEANALYVEACAEYERVRREVVS